MTLDYPSPEAVAQSVRMRLDATEPDVPFLIVEGKADRSFVARVLHPGVVVVSASNREKVLGARALLKASHLKRCTFLVDCDGWSDTESRSLLGVVVTDYRDIDADAALSLEGMHRVVTDLLANQFDTGNSLARAVNEVVFLAVQATTWCGVVTDRARAEGLPIRIFYTDSHGRQRRRRVRADDLPEFAAWAAALRGPREPRPFVDALASRLGWSAEQHLTISEAVSRGGEKQCRNHRQPNCVPCLPRRFANGHDLIAVLRAILVYKFSVTLEEGGLDRSIRLGVDEAQLGAWRVVRRFGERQSVTGLRYLRESIPSPR